MEVVKRSQTGDGRSEPAGAPLILNTVPLRRLVDNGAMLGWYREGTGTRVITLVCATLAGTSDIATPSRPLDFGGGSVARHRLIVSFTMR
jgi:hypothetical protein